MPKFDKPDSPNIIWGVNALDEDLTRPDDSYIQTGWTQVKPPYEYENYSMNKLYQGFAYYNQQGIPEWDGATEYQANKSYVQGSNNKVYKCVQTHSNKNPATAGNEAYWELFEGNRQANTSSRGTVELATTPETRAGTSDTLAVTPKSLLQGIIGTGNLQGKGHVKIPVSISGIKKEFVIQWGLSSGSISQTFDISFPTSPFGVVFGDAGSEEPVGYENLTTTGFDIVSNHAPLTFFWIAIGH